MKYFVVSDLHGSYEYAQKIFELFEQEKADQILYLGDLYYHGPRNPLPNFYHPQQVADLFNQHKQYLRWVKGNCDAEVDEMISEFPAEKEIRFKINNKVLCFTHGHQWNINCLPKGIDILIYGHFHTNYMKEKDGVLCVCVGSIALPKDDTPHSYVIIDEKEITLKDVAGNVLDKKSIGKRG